MHTTQTVGNVQVKFEDLESERPICNIFVTGELTEAQKAYVKCLELEYRVSIFTDSYKVKPKAPKKKSLFLKHTKGILYAIWLSIVVTLSFFVFVPYVTFFQIIECSFDFVKKTYLDIKRIVTLLSLYVGYKTK